MDRRRARSVVGWTRLVATIPAVGMFVCSMALDIAVLQEIFSSVHELAMGHMKLSAFIVECVEFADQFLLGIALLILALGLVNLFITPEVPLPPWLEFHDFEDLKETLVAVVVVMMGVHFLGELLRGVAGQELLLLGGAVSLVVAALTVFVSRVFKSH